MEQPAHKRRLFCFAPPHVTAHGHICCRVACILCRLWPDSGLNHLRRLPHTTYQVSQPQPCLNLPLQENDGWRQRHSSSIPDQAVRRYLVQSRVCNRRVGFIASKSVSQ